MRFLWFLLALVGGCHAAVASSSGWQTAKHLQAELVSEYSQVMAGQRLRLALHFVPDEHWHTYWKNPGDSGLPTSLHWEVPEWVTVGDIQWPTPQAFVIPPLVNYGFAGQTLLLVDVSLSADYAHDTVPIQLQADWLVCDEICIPAEAHFLLSLPVGSTPVKATSTQPLFMTAEQRLPIALDTPGSFETLGGAFSAVLDWPLNETVSAFFVATPELVDHAAVQLMNLQDEQLLLQQSLNTYFSTAPQQLELVIVTAQGAYSVQLQYTQAAETSTFANDVPIAIGLGWILLMAAAGGLLLNLMPCVFPVLSLKALSIAASHAQPNTHRRDALIYTMGVLCSFTLLALILIALRSAGEAVGWGFQLQSPPLVAILVYLLFALGLSLSGVVQFGLGVMHVGDGLARAKGTKGAFFTGVLAVVVASPCTAPFMGTALGYAVSQSNAVALLVFVALGVGMASPFLVLGFVPSLARMLPRPGAWMDTFKQWLAFPLYLSAVWLLWVYGRQSGVDALAWVLVGTVCIAAACWLWGRKQQALAGTSTALLAVLLLLLALVFPFLVPRATLQGVASVETQRWQPWSAETLQQLQADGKPVLVNMTADWCITCLVNERVALTTVKSQAALTQYGVTYLKGDWTLRDAGISEYLRQYQRDGVPLYVIYWPGQPPEVLPQILTPDTLATTLERLSRQP